MRARALLLAALTALACARPCSPSGFADAMDVAAARRVLGVEGVASAEQTRAAFHRASLRAHPDKPGGSHEAFVEVTEAYDVLRNGAGARGARARSGFASGEPWRDGAGGQSRGGDAPAGSPGFSSGESHAFAWRFSSPDADAGAEASAERSARAREFERFQRARHAWEPRARDAEPPSSRVPRGGNGRRAWWDGGAKKPPPSSRAETTHRDRRARARYDPSRYRTYGDDGYIWHEDTDTAATYDESSIDRSARDKWWDTKSDVFHGAYGTASDVAVGARASRRGRRDDDVNDDLESMEEYVFRRAWADARGVAGHDRRLDDGAASEEPFSEESFSTTAEPSFRVSGENGDEHQGWDAARRRASSAQDDAFGAFNSAYGA